MFHVLKGWVKRNLRRNRKMIGVNPLVHWRFIHVCFIQVTMCGAPDMLTRLGARTFQFSSRLLGSDEQISVGKCAHQGAWAPSGATNDVPNCHLDQTNMDNSSMHPQDSLEKWKRWCLIATSAVALPMAMSAVGNDCIYTLKEEEDPLSVDSPEALFLDVSTVCHDPQTGV